MPRTAGFNPKTEIEPQITQIDTSALPTLLKVTDFIHVSDIIDFMKIPGFLIFSGLLTMALVVAEKPEMPMPAIAEDQLAKDIDVMVRELMDENFKVREKASQDLWEMGEAALPALQAAAKSQEPEQALRARELLRKIHLHITPTTAPDVMAMVERYSKASAKEKMELLSGMMQKQAWRQMLKLYATETKEEIRTKLSPIMSGISVRAAREALLKGKTREAREYLELAPVDPSGLLALAEFHRTHGTLQVEIDRAKTLKGGRSEAWQLALQRAAGNTTAAHDAAIAAGEPQIAAAMSVLAGDPMPWFELGSVKRGRDRFRQNDNEDPFAEEEEERSMTKAYAAAVIKRWKGQPLLAKDLKSITDFASSRIPSVSGPAVGELFLLSEIETAEKAFAKNSPLAAFIHFDSLERIPDALSSLGIDPAKPDYKKWVEKRFKKLAKNDIEDQHEASTENEELQLLANFLERRGLHNEAWEAFSPALQTLAKEDEDRFLNFLGSLFGSRTRQIGAPKLASRFLKEWAGNDEKHWDDMVAASFGDNEDVDAWWSWLADLDPKATLQERFDGLFALNSTGGDSSGLREKWMTLAWKQVDGLPAGERTPLLKRILILGVGTGDVANTLRAWDPLAEGDRPEHFWLEIIFHLSAAGRWDDCASLILKQIDEIAKSRDDLNPALHAFAASAFRKAGRLQDAAVHDAWVDKLALGDAHTAIQIGHGYSFGHDFDRASEWWARAALQAEPDSGEIESAFKLHADALLKKGNWKEVAAISEALIWMDPPNGSLLESPLPVMRLRLQADMARAITLLKTNRPAALAILAKCHKIYSRDGSLADFFFPTLRKEGLMKEHDAWFDETWAQINEVIKRYPESDNTGNTAAWFAARAARKLDEAEKILTKSLASKPHQSAYLDTMAEIQFARGNRKKALEWSSMAINHQPKDPDLRRQHIRFLSDPLPE